jgi:hypothetical protein
VFQNKDDGASVNHPRLATSWTMCEQRVEAREIAALVE